MFTICCGALCVSCLFVFFKQKTAYEMRISDWSSDVCSSDLAQRKAEFVDRTRHLVLKAAHPSPLSAHNGFLGCRHFSQANAFLEEKIGRASCRERVCQYV